MSDSNFPVDHKALVKISRAGLALPEERAFWYCSSQPKTKR